VIALDTNVIVRFLTRDDPVQAPRARALIMVGPVLVQDTVLLESEWVLRTRYQFDRVRIAEAFRRLLGLPSVELEDELVLAQALDWFGAGLDFADALHLARTPPGVAFATFDRALRRRAAALPGTPELRAP
jgi:predicted nucleic-acid-binding protein